MSGPISIEKANIKIKNLTLDVYLGVSELEQMFAQPVSFSFKFDLTPEGSNEDNLDNLLCYNSLITALKNFLSGRKYKTVEYLTKAVYFFLNSYSSSIKNLELTIQKLNPPLDGNLRLEEVKINIRSKKNG